MCKLKTSKDNHFWIPRTPLFMPHHFPQSPGSFSNQCMKTLGFFCTQPFGNTLPFSSFFASLSQKVGHHSETFIEGYILEKSKEHLLKRV